MPRCKANTKSGIQCLNNTVKGSDYCHIEAHQALEGRGLKKRVISLLAKVVSLIFLLGALAEFTGFNARDTLESNRVLEITVGNIETGDGEEIELIYTLPGDDHPSFVTIPLKISNPADVTAKNIEISYKFLEGAKLLKVLPEKDSNKLFGIGPINSMFKGRETNFSGDLQSSTVFLSGLNPSRAVMAQEPILFTKAYLDLIANNHFLTNIPAVVTVSADDFAASSVKIWITGLPKELLNKDGSFGFFDATPEGRRKTLALQHHGKLGLYDGDPAYMIQDLSEISYKEIEFEKSRLQSSE